MNAQRSSRIEVAVCRITSIFARSLLWLAPLALASLAACGGGDGATSAAFGGGVSSSSSSSSSSSAGDGWVAGVYPPESQYVARCQNPRTGIDPATGQAYPDIQGSTLEENFWLRSWTNDNYLWYSEVPDLDPGTYSTTAAYFTVLMTSATDSLGEPKDKFHFTEATSQWEQFSQAGVDIGYGLTWALIANVPPRQLYVAYVWPGGAAQAAGLARGAQILTIDGVDVANGADVDTLNEGLSPTSAGESHTFTYQNSGSSTTQTVTLQAQQVTETPVPIVTTIATPTGTVGYILYNDVIATSEQELINAINQLKAANVSDLVLDLRYNGGGLLDIASELAYMIAGPTQTAGAYFEQDTFNDKHPDVNPFGQTTPPTPFYTTTQPGFTTQSGGTALPYLGLQKLYVLTGTSTCSASEAVINGLTGVNVQVIQIGSGTCGKPYGFYPQDNCGTSYFAIEFQGDNFARFGDYPDGFVPQNASQASEYAPGAVLPGCSVADDFSNALGAANEGRLAAALAYRTGGSASCPAATGTGAPATVHAQERLAIHVAPWKTIRILRRPARP
ncbi:MAG: S41 family peptidase [Steroidobacteraceae bacterium]